MSVDRPRIETTRAQPKTLDAANQLHAALTLFGRGAIGYLVAAFFLVPVSGLAGQQSDLVIRTKRIPEAEVFVGQRVRVQIEVLGKDSWASLSKLPELKVSGALVYQPQSQSVRLNETIDGDSYTGQQYEWWVYPQRVGKIEMQSMSVEGNFKTFGVDAEQKPFTSQVDAIEFQAKLPAGVPANTLLFCADQLQLEQSWEPEGLNQLKLGDGITRTIKRTATGTPAMILPNLPPFEPPGVREYPGQLQVSDAVNRGSLTGTRIDTTSYVFESSGTYTIPKLKLSWWNNQTSRLETVEIPGRVIEVSPPMSTNRTVDSGSAARGRFSWSMAWTGIIIVAVMAGLIWLNYYRVRNWMDRFISQPYFVERQAFQEIVSATKTNQARPTLQALMHWLNLVQPDDPAPQIGRLVARYGNQQIKNRCDSLLLAVDDSAVKWEGQDFLTGIRELRHNLRRQKSRVNRAGNASLPELNPGSPADYNA